MKINKIEPVFVDKIPNVLEEGKLYISEKYKMAIHRCACGCGEETVTPLDENGWTLENNNNIVSLSPSIGNFSFKCKSHYFIKENKIIWC